MRPDEIFVAALVAVCVIVLIVMRVQSGRRHE
jgi:hypothetical protein